MSAILSIAKKDVVLLLRDKTNAFFTLVFPLFVAIFFGAIFGGGGGGGGKLTVAVVNEDGGPGAAAFIADLAADESIEVVTARNPSKGAPATPLSRDDATSMLRLKSADACVVLPPGFGDPARGLFSGKPMKLEAIVPPGRSAEAGLLTGKLNEIAFKSISRTFTNPAAMTTALGDARKSIDSSTMSPLQKTLLNSIFDSADSLTRDVNAQVESNADADAGAKKDSGPSFRPVEVDIHELAPTKSTSPRSSWETSFPQGVVWGLMGAVMAFAVSLTEERSRGTFIRLNAAPISRGHVLAGKAVACFVVCMIVQLVLLGAGVLIFGVRPTNWAMMLAAMALSALGAIGVVMLIAAAARSEGAAMGMARGVVILLAMIGGGSVPVFFMPPFVQKLSLLSPFRWSQVSIEASLWASYSWGEFALPAGVLLAVAVLGFFGGAALMNRGGDR